MTTRKDEHRFREILDACKHTHLSSIYPTHKFYRDDEVLAAMSRVAAGWDEVRAELNEHCSKIISERLASLKRLEDALKGAIKVAEEAREEWDTAPAGMRAGKILIALSGGCRGYRKDIDEIHDTLAALDRDAS